MSKREEDLVTAMLRAVCEEWANAPPGAILRIEQRVRQHWGGERAYILKSRAVANHGGVPRSTFYHWGAGRGPGRRGR